MIIEDLEKAVEELPLNRFAKFRVWFEELNASRNMRHFASRGF